MTDDLLLVDDESGIRRVLTIFLADLGYHVLTAASGEEALQVFQAHHPPIVITDVKMPGMDGIALLKRIKSIRPETEVIVVTGHGDMDTAIESLKLDAADFITKPINTDALDISLNRARKKIDLRRQLKEYTENLEQMVQETSARLVEAERRSAASQVVEGLFAAIESIGDNLEAGFRYFDDMPCMVSVHSRELKILAVNPFFRERLGDGTGADSWRLYAGETGSRDRCPAAEVLKLGTYRRSAEVIEADGQKISVIVYAVPIRNRHDEIELVLEIACDMTGTESLQKDLEAARQRYRKLFDEVPCYISVQDRALRLVEINRRFKEDFGDRPGEHCFQVYKNRDTPCTDCPVIKTFADGDSHQHETVVTANDGSRYNVLISTAPIRDAAGDITHVMEMSTNITEIRQLQNHLESLGLMIGTVSHGIKGILTGLDGGLYILDSGIQKNNGDDIREGRVIVGRMARRIKTMVLDILYYAKERDLARDRITVDDFAGDVALTMAARMRENAIAFDTRFDPAAGELEVDVDALQSAFTNILENAVDACAGLPEGQPKAISFTADADGDGVVFSIADTGVGMDADTREKLFNLFFSTKGHGGTGLGLFISKKIIEQHDGSVAVDSKKGQGTTFTIRIPRRAAADRTRPAPDPETP
ncbi:MAG: response regulator [Desulfobacterales bacterium]|jgi:PAS domain S-box-containing protein